MNKAHLEATELLNISDLKVHYPVKVKKGFSTEKRFVKAVDGVTFSVMKGETLGIVGESGCGKTTTGKTIVRLLKPTSGSIFFEGKNLFETTKQESQEISKKIQIIFQDPYSSLDPRFTVGRSIGEPLVVHKWNNAKMRKERVLELMNDVGLRKEHFTRFPHEFSGGQRQRIGVARSLSLNPSLIVCDEPVSALDVSIQAQILNLMQELQHKYNLTYVFISHDLGVVKYICDRIAVMYLGNLVEISSKRDMFKNPQHPYTKALLNAIPIANPDIKSMQQILKGDVPSPMNPPSGCCFHTRCQYATEKCSQEKPILKETEPGHLVACHLF